MAQLILETNIHKGSLIESVSGNLITPNANVNFSKTNKGWSIVNKSGGKIDIDKIIPNDTYTAVFWVSASKLNSYIMDLRTSSGTGFVYISPASKVIATSNGTIYINNIQTSNINFNRIYCIVASGITLNASKIVLLQSYTGGGVNGVNIIKTKIYKGILTSKEREREQIEFEAAQPLTYQKRLLQLPKPTELKQSGLIAAYNMKPVGNILHDISGNGNNLTLTGGITIQTNKGISFPNSGYYKTASFINTPTTSFTICCRIKLNELGREQHIAEFGNQQLYVSSANKIICGSGGNAIIGITTVNKNSSYNIIYIYNNGNSSLYIQALSEGTSVGNITLTSTFRIGHLYSETGNYKFNGTIQDVRIYNRVLSTQEIKAYHNSFNEITLQESFDDMAVGSSKLPNGWIKSGGSFVCEEHTKKKGELNPNPTFESNSNGWAGANMSILWNVTKDITCTATTVSDTRILISTQILATGKRYRLTFNAKSSNSTVKLNILNSYGYYLSAIVINNPNLTTEYQQYIIEATTPNGYVYINFEVGNDKEVTIDNVSVIEIDPLPTIKNRTKYLKCNTAGIVAIPSKQAYGTWEFDWFKGGDGNEMLFSIISPTIKGSLDTLNNYFISMTTQESIGLIKNGGINWLFFTNTSYASNNTWYRIRITRTTSGVFSIYILGGNFTNWTLVSTTGGSGTNPVTDNTYTTSNYFVMDLDANDRVGNILIQSQIRV